MKRKRHKCVLVYKFLNMLVPQYLCNYFSRNYNVHSYETRRRTNLHLPKPKLGRGKRSFKYLGMVFFNLLSRYIQKAESLSFFFFDEYSRFLTFRLFKLLPSLYLITIYSIFTLLYFLV